MSVKTSDMGCLLGICRQHSEEQDNSNAAPETQPTYSWDKRPRLDPKDYSFDGCVNEEKIKLPGSINGEQFVIENCKQSSLYIFDHCNSVNIDDCEDCKIFIGPVKTSVFVRDCNNCTVIVACQQLRTRDCRRISFFLSCVSQPIIEASTQMRFGPYQFHYPGLKNHFQAAGHSVFNSIWSDIYDFTPVDDQKNYSLISEETNPLDLFPPPSESSGVEFKLEAGAEVSVVPVTHGKRRKPSTETCFVAVFTDTEQEQRTWQILRELQMQTNCLLIQTHETKLDEGEAKNIFQSDIPVSYSGPVVGLEYNGTGCVATCQRVVRAMGLSEQAVHVSSDDSAATGEVERFYSTISMLMNAH